MDAANLRKNIQMDFIIYRKRFCVKLMLKNYYPLNINILLVICKYGVLIQFLQYWHLELLHYYHIFAVTINMYLFIIIYNI